MVYDTGAQLNCGYAGYHLAIAKAFPSIVKSLIWAEDKYAPLVLSGVVNNDEDKKAKSIISTTLPAVIEYHTAYQTSQGIPITLKVAIGNDVSVNTIMGLSTIKSAGVTLDTDAKVFQVSILNNMNFEAVFKPTTCRIPDLTPIHKAHPCALELSMPNAVTPQDVVNCYNAVFRKQHETGEIETETDKPPSMDNDNKTPSPIKKVTFEGPKGTLFDSY